MYLNLLGAFFGILAAISMTVGWYFIRKSESLKAPENIVLIASLLGLLFFTPLAIILNYPYLGLFKGSIFIFAVVGLLIFVFRICAYKGVRKIGASRVSPITRGNILIASLIAILFLGETVEFLHLIGIILLFIGVALVSYESGKNNSDTKSMFSLDLIFPLIAMIVSGIASPLVSFGYGKGVPITLAIAMQQLVCFIAAVSLFWCKGWSLSEPFRVKERYFYIGAALGILGSLAAWNLGLRIAPVVIVQPLRATAPLFVLIISYLYLKHLETITKKLVFGVFLTVLGAMLIGIFM